jgi:hypothetical protein
MKALEFEARVNPDHTLLLPSSVASEVPPGQTVRVLLLIQEAAEDADWERFGVTEFAEGYADSDAIYDQLSGR